jgi:hypothetical protein
MNLLRGLNVQEALDAPRFCISAGLGEVGDVNSAIYLEEGIPSSVVRQLRGLYDISHPVSLLIQGPDRKGTRSLSGRRFRPRHIRSRSDYQKGRGYLWENGVGCWF